MVHLLDKLGLLLTIFPQNLMENQNLIDSTCEFFSNLRYLENSIMALFETTQKLITCENLSMELCNPLLFSKFHAELGSDSKEGMRTTFG